MAKANSNDAKNTRTPATTIAAVVNCKTKRTAIISVIKKPKRAAKIFGALSIGLCSKFRALANRWLKKLIGLNFAFVNARIKKSANRNAKNITLLKANPEITRIIPKIAFRRVTLSLIFSFDIGQTICFIVFMSQVNLLFK